MARRAVPLPERLWSHASDAWEEPGLSAGCWEFRGRHNAKGYGYINRGRRGEGNGLTHRIAWELTRGPIPADMDVLHHCDNPPCVRPSHLFLGTNADNNRDMAAKGRAARQAGAANGRARLTADQVREIRAATASHVAVAAAYGVAQTTVRDIRNGRRWKGLQP